MDRAVTVPRRWHRLPVKDVAEASSADLKQGLDPREVKKKFHNHWQVATWIKSYSKKPE